MYAYSVAIKLSVANLASQGLRLIAADMLKAHGIATSLQTKLSAMKLAAVGYGLDRLGTGIFHGLEKTVTAAQEYTRQLSLMNAAGMSQAEIAQSIGSAWSTTRDVVTSTAAENLKQLRELRSLFGDQHMGEAYAVLPAVMRAQAIMESLTGQKDERMGFEMAKVAELRQTGVMTLPFLQRNVQDLSRTLLAMGGTITTSDFLMTMKYAKTSALTFSDQFVYDYLPTLIQEMKARGGGGGAGGGSAGTALMTLYSAIVQGKIPKAAIPLFTDIGLVKPSEVIRNATGSFQIRPGGVEGAQLFQQNPFAWAQMVAPQIERYAKAHHLNLTQVLTSMFPARNAQFMLNTLISKAGQFERDRSLIESTPGNYQSYQRLLQTNPMLAQQALHAQWQNVLAVIGYQILPRLVPYMVTFAKDLDSLGQWIQRHPKLTEGLVIGLGGLGIALSIVGKVMMSAALIKFLGLGPALGTMFSSLGAFLINPITLIVGAIALVGVGIYELWKHWNVVWPWIKGIWHDMGTIAASMWAGIKSGMTGIASWMRDEWHRLTDWFHHGSPSSSLAPSPAAADWAASGGSPAAARYIVTRAPSTTVVHTQINMDGKKIATATTRHIAGALGASQTGTSIFDGRHALAPAGGT